MSGRGTRPTWAAALIAAAGLMVPGAALAQAAKPTSLSETYTNWTVSCRATTAEGKTTRRCQMTQELQEKAGEGRRVLGVILTLQDANAELTVITPLGIALSSGVSIELGDASLVKMAYSTCRPAGCFANGPLTAKMLSSLDSAPEATTRLGTLDGQPLLIKFPLPGFAEARKRLAELVKG